MFTLSRNRVFSIRIQLSKGALRQPKTICGVASSLANTHICIGLALKGLLTP